MNSLLDHVNGKTRFKKMGLGRVIIEKEDSTMIAWTLIMQECGLSINLQQFKMKVVELTQTRVTPFRDGIPSKSWWFQFKRRHQKISIRQVEGLEVCRAQGLTPNSCNYLDINLQSLYNQHKYSSNNKWNYDETKIQVG